MKRQITFILSLLLCMGLYVPGMAQEENTKGIQFHKNESWEKMLELAKKENKMIFMDCYTVWCGPCKGLARDIFPQEKVGNYFNPRFINVQYDMEKGDGKMLYEKYKKYIIGFPTMLLIDKDGNVLQQLAGYQEADKLIEGIKNAAEGKDLFTLGKKYAEGERDFAFIKDYIDGLNAAFLKDSAAVVATDYLARMDVKELDKDEVWNVLGDYIKDVNSPAFAYVVKNANSFYYKLHRDRYKIDRQLRYALERELDKIVEIKFDDKEQPLPLHSDTVMEQKILSYMADLGLAGQDQARIKVHINHLLLDGNYEEAWRWLKGAVDLHLSGFYYFTLDDYVRYMMSKTSDKKLLRRFLAALEESERVQGEKELSYRVYKTMSELNKTLGNKKKADEQLKIYKQKEEEVRKKFADFFKTEEENDDKAGGE